MEIVLKVLRYFFQIRMDSDSIFKIECNGDFREGRALALLSSMVTHNIQHIDMAIISSDGITIPTNRGVLALHSKFISKVS